MIHTYKVKGMTCNKCVSKVQKTLSEIDGIENVSVTLNPPTAVVSMKHHISSEDMNSALEKVGNYSVEGYSNYIPPGETIEKPNDKSIFSIYKPLIIVFFYIIVGIIILQVRVGSLDWMEVMNNFMGGFFMIFSFFKMLDLKNFAYSYSSYDVVAKKLIGYGYIYPFIELILGIMFLIKAYPIFTNFATLIVMGVSSVGVFQSLVQKRKIQCACLGTVFNLPMSTITLIEDLLMVLMSAIMLIYFFVIPGK